MLVLAYFEFFSHNIWFTDQGCILQKNFRQSHNYFQSHGTIFNEQYLNKISNLQLYRIL